MPADNVEFSGDPLFRLYYWEDLVAGVNRTSIRLEHAPTSRILLDLTDDGSAVDSYSFSPDGNLLHLKLSRLDRSVVGFPATIDLRTGLFYHHPIPKQAMGPAGDVEDLEKIAKTGRPSDAGAARQRAERWPTADELEWAGGLPGAALMNNAKKQPPAPASEPKADPPKPQTTQFEGRAVRQMTEEEGRAIAAARIAPVFSPDGFYVAQFEEFEMRMSHTVRTCWIMELATGRVAVDFRQTLYQVEVEFQQQEGRSGMVKLELWKYPGDRPPFSVMVNLSSETYWDLTEAGEIKAGEFPVRRLTKSL